MMSKIDWSKAPDWATCVVIHSGRKFSTDYHWSEEPKVCARMRRIETGTEFTMSRENLWEIVEKRPTTGRLLMTPKAGEHTYEQFIAQGWDDDTLIHEGYAVIKPIPDVTVTNVDEITKYKQLSLADLHLAHLMEKTPTVPMFKNNHDYKIENKEYTVDENAIREFSNSRCTFTPVQQPSTAPDLLNQAAQLLTERGKQYDTSGQERSSAKIVAAFNTITGRDLTPGEGWLFLMLLKAVRFYSNTEIPHRDSLEDLIAYAALHAEEYLNNER